MKIDFDKLNDRRGTNSSKWNIGENELPMWVADMDFQTVPEVIDAMQQDVARGIFGYQYVPDEYYQAVKDWEKVEHDFDVDPEWLTFTTGVIPTIGDILRHLTDAGDNVLIQEPNYNSFYKVITNNGHQILNNELIYQDGQYLIDWTDLEEKLSDPQTTSMFLCNPHNPSGHIWSKDDLEKLAKLTNKYNVLVISDEIHGDILMPGKQYTPFASLDESLIQNSISLVSPSKTFNLAVLHAATAITPNENLRQRLQVAVGTNGHAEPGVLAINASIAAYTKGHDWLDQLREYVGKNRELLTEFVKDNLTDVTVVKGDATYLAWIDVTKISHDSSELNDFLRRETGLYLAEGTKYKGNGNDFLRMNLATTRSRVEDGLNRLKTGLEKYQAKH